MQTTKHEIRIVFPAFEKYVEYLIGQDSSQAKIDAISDQLSKAKADLSTTNAELKSAVNQQEK